MTDRQPPQSPRPPLPHRRTTRLVAAALLTLFAALFVGLDHATMSGDGMAIYVVADSLLRDGDFDLANQDARYHEQVERMAPYALVRHPVTGHPVSAWPFGMAVLWAPFLYAFWWLESLGWFASPYFMYEFEVPGTFRAIGLALVLAANVWGLVAWGLATRTAATAIRTWEAMLAAFAVFVGTPLLFYTTIEPTFSHVGDAATVAALVWAWCRFRRNTWAHGLAIGILAGIAILVRWHLATYALVLGASCLLFREWRRAAGVALGIALLCWPISYSWDVMGGSPWRPPILDVSRGYLRAPQPLLVLFSDLRGLLPWSPVAALGLAGLVAGLGRHRRLATELLLCVVAQLVVSSMVWDWWAGHSFGNRRLVNLYALLVVGTAWLIERAGSAGERWSPRAGRVARGTVLALSGVLAWHTFLLALYYYPSQLDRQWMTHSQLAREWREAGTFTHLWRYYRYRQHTVGLLTFSGQTTPTEFEQQSMDADRPIIDWVDVRTSTIVVYGRKFELSLVVNLFQQQDGSVVNLGGLTAEGAPAITLRSFSDTRIEFDVPSRLQAGDFSVQVVTPPYGPETTSAAVASARVAPGSR